MKRLALLFSILGLFVSVCVSQETGKRSITMGTGGTTGVYFPVGKAMAEIWSEKVPGLSINPVSTGASIANLLLLRDDKVQVIFVQSDIAAWAFKGSEMFSGEAFKDLRFLASLYPETCQIVTRKDADIQSLSELAGKRVGIGVEGSGQALNSRHILAAAGLKLSDIKPVWKSFAESAADMELGRLDAAFATSAHPSTAVQRLLATGKFKLLPLSDEMVNILRATHPFYIAQTIPAGTYPDQDLDIPCVAVKAILATRADFDPRLVELMLTTLFDSTEWLGTAHPRAREIRIETALEGLPIPLHPGARRYYEKVGIAIPRLIP